MDIPAAAGPWIAFGVVLGIVLLGAAGLAAALLLRRSSGATPARPDPPADEAPDDLAAFLEHPPGSPGERRRPVAGWAALSGPPPPAPVAATPGRPVRRRSLAAVAVGAALLAGAAVAVAVGQGDGDPGRRAAATGTPTADPSGPPAARGDVEARLSFGGLVLERHAVGVTAAYPELRLTGGRAHLELTTFNCLSGAAPADPAGAGCRRTVPEYAELAAPELRVTETGDGWAISGRFVTETRPNGGPPVPTGRAYELVVDVAAGEPGRNGWRPAEGTLRLGEDEAATTGTDAAAAINVLRSRDR